MTKRQPLLVVTLLCGATLQSASAETAPPAADDKLTALVEEYYDQYLEMNPVSATQIGDNRFNDQYPNDISPAYHDQAVALEQRYHDQVGALDPASLSESARLTREIFLSRAELNIAGARFPNELLPIDQFSNQAADFAVLGSGTGAQPFVTEKDYRDFLKRMQGFHAWCDQAIVNMREGAAHGTTVPHVVMAKVLPQLDALIVKKPTDSLFYKPLKSLPQGMSSDARKRLTADYEREIMHTVATYRRLRDYIRDDYLPKTRTSVAWSALPDGHAWYAYYVERYTTTKMTPEEIHELGLKEVARIEGEMNAVREQVGFQGDLPAFFRHLQEDPQFYYTSADDLLNGYRALKLKIDALLPREFADFPKADYEIRAVEPFRAQSAAGAFYVRPSADGKRPGIFYINTYNLKQQPRYGMETLSLHEAAPGHHFQLSIQQELTGLPRFRRFSGYVAYSEGWALYCESIGKELGLFTDPYQYYGRLSDEMLRAMRLVVDTGLHVKGWTREQAIDYMRTHSSMAESDVVAEVERYISFPGQALGYKVGQLRISAMRARAEAALGARFDVKAFHSVVLRDGAVPMDVLEKKVDRWIASQKS